VGRKTVATIGCCLLNAIHQQKISMSMLFSPIELGPYQLSHRVAMAPLTRMRSDPGDIPSALMIEYYTQRASNVGLIISEATPVSTRGNGYAGAPGIYSDRQIAVWRRVTDAVHVKGVGFFFSCGMSGVSRIPTCSPTGMRRLRPPRLRRKVMPIRRRANSRSP
jgi:N-ethylmaleimide reductase